VKASSLPNCQDIPGMTQSRAGELVGTGIVLFTMLTCCSESFQDTSLPRAEAIKLKGTKVRELIILGGASWVTGLPFSLATGLSICSQIDPEVIELVRLSQYTG